MSQDKNTPQNPIGGMSKDVALPKHPADKVLFMLNGINQHFDGEQGSIGNEPGNELCYNTPYPEIGHIVLNREETIVFSTDGIDSEIGSVDSECNYTTVINAKCLTFNKCFQIKGQHRVRNGCDRMIYFNDCTNTDKVINLDRLGDYYTDEYNDYVDATPSPVDPNTYEATIGTAWDCNLMAITPDQLVPCIELNSVNNSGGRLEVGSYAFAVQYLDNSFNPQGYFYLSPIVPIYNENLNAPYREIDGALNLVAGFTPEEGAVPTTNKSIDLLFTDLDPDFPFLKVGVVRWSNGDATTFEVFELEEIIPAGTNQVSWKFTGISTGAGDIQTDIAAITIPRAAYTTSCVMQQVDNRLLRADLKENVRDWSQFQRNVSGITSTYIAGRQGAERIDESSMKSPDYYWYNRSYMRDEIYAFGIVFIFKDGTESPVFHIPGRSEILSGNGLIATGNANGHYRNQVPALTDWDKQILTVKDVVVTPDTQVNSLDVKHLGLIEDDTIERWKVWNTAIRTGVNANNDREGVMSYHECEDITYPDIRDCNGDSIWGDDSAGNPLVGQKVRHHKFPDTVFERNYAKAGLITADESIYSVGIKFDTSTLYSGLPANIKDAIQGHYFVRADRTEDNKTIFDKGMFVTAQPKADASGTYIAAPGGNDGGNFNNSDFIFNVSAPSVTIPPPFTGFDDTGLYNIFVSPETQFTRRNMPADYIKVEWIRDHTFGAFPGEIPPAGTPGHWGGFAWTEDASATILNDSSGFTMRPIEKTLYVDHGAEAPGGLGFNVRNDLDSTDLLFVQITDVLQDVAGVADNEAYYVSMKKLVPNPYQNIFSLPYYRTHSCEFRGGAEGTNFIDEVFGGDIFIGNMTFFTGFGRDGFTPPDVYTGSAYVQWKFYMESEVNSELRHAGTDRQDRYYQGTGGPITFLAGRVYEDPATNDIIVADNYYDYNPDYSVEPQLDGYLPLQRQFNYCTDCLNEYPNRMVYSQVATDTEIADSYRTYLPNNFVDLPGHTGRVTNIKYDRSQMIVNTLQSLFNIAPNPQVLNTDQDFAYIGTGDFLGIPANEFVKTDYGYAGNQGRFNAINTEHGYVFVDQDAGRIFNMSSQGLQPISEAGMSNWFDENLPSKFKSMAIKFGIDYECYDNISNKDKGIGLMAVYDPRYERYILHKSDFELTLARKAQFIGVVNKEADINLPIQLDGDVFFVNADQKFVRVSGTAPNPQILIDLSFANEDDFINNSWTISYSFKQKSWTSFHSYQPSYMYGTQDTYFTSNFDTGVWRHKNQGNYGNFYGEQFDWVVEYVINDLMTSDLHAVHWYSRTQEYDETNQFQVDIDSVTFNKLLAYNSCQSTGELVLSYLDPITSPAGNLGWSNTTKSVILTDKNYKVAQLRDLSIAQPTITSDWEDANYQAEFNKVGGRQGYIDRVTLSSSIDTTRPQYLLRDLKDKYFIVRLYFTNPGDYKMVLDLINSKKFYSMR